MSETEQPSFNMVKMLTDYMEEGLLENIVSMFKADKTAYELIGKMIIDERIRVRLGVTALIEILSEEDPHNIPLAGPSLMKVLTHKNPTFRGDAANLLGIMRYKDALPLLKKLTEDEEDAVRQIAREAIDEIMEKQL